MKKIALSLFMAVMLILAMAFPAFAAAEDVTFSTMVVDNADILTGEQEDALDSKAWEITQEYGCAVYIVTVDDLEGYEVGEYCEKIHSKNDMGYGPDQSCVMLLLSMSERDYNIMAHGYGNTAFTDYGKEKMAERFLDEFGDDDWNGGFEEYLECSEEYLELAASGEPFDVGSDRNPILGLALGIGVPIVIAHKVCSKFKAQMKTAKKQRMARVYVVGQGVTLTTKEDRFSHTTRNESYIQPKKEKSGGTTVNSRGSSHKGGKF